MKHKTKIIVLFSFLLLICNTSLAQRKKTRVVESVTQNSEQSGKILKRKVAIGRFSNETQYAKGLFYDKSNDPMGKQALDILSAKLAASGKFLLLERSDLDVLMEEARTAENGIASIGADYLIIGSVTEFGRKNTGKSGVFTNKKTQTVEAAVAIRLVDVSTGMIIYSEEGKGTAEMTSKSVMGLGGHADYDATLSDKAISEAIGQLVENIINKCTNKPWRTYFLSFDNSGKIIAGGESQGLSAGDVLAVKTKGKKVKNPQTGIMIDLPGDQIGTVTIESTGGDTPETEYSIVSYSGSDINSRNINQYVIEEIKK